MTELADDDRCPCSTGEQYGSCCGRFHRGETEAPSAELLMRSRYTAFYRNDAEYLLRTWHPDTRPPSFDADAGRTWWLLDVLSTDRGGMLERDGVVEFRAYYRDVDSRGGVHHERSRFLRDGRSWRYFDGVIAP